MTKNRVALFPILDTEGCPRATDADDPESYTPFTDPFLVHYMARPTVRRNLVRAGKLEPEGVVVHESAFRARSAILDRMERERERQAKHEEFLLKERERKKEARRRAAATEAAKQRVLDMRKKEAREARMRRRMEIDGIMAKAGILQVPAHLRRDKGKGKGRSKDGSHPPMQYIAAESKGGHHGRSPKDDRIHDERIDDNDNSNMKMNGNGNDNNYHQELRPHPPLMRGGNEETFVVGGPAKGKRAGGKPRARSARGPRASDLRERGSERRTRSRSRSRGGGRRRVQSARERPPREITGGVGGDGVHGDDDDDFQDDSSAVIVPGVASSAGDNHSDAAEVVVDREMLDAERERRKRERNAHSQGSPSNQSPTAGGAQRMSKHEMKPLTASEHAAFEEEDARWKAKLESSGLRKYETKPRKKKKKKPVDPMLDLPRAGANGILWDPPKKPRPEPWDNVDDFRWEDPVDRGSARKAAAAKMPKTKSVDMPRRLVQLHGAEVEREFHLKSLLVGFTPAKARATDAERRKLLRLAKKSESRNRKEAEKRRLAGGEGRSRKSKTRVEKLRRAIAKSVDGDSKNVTFREDGLSGSSSKRRVNDVNDGENSEEDTSSGSEEFVGISKSTSSKALDYRMLSHKKDITMKSQSNLFEAIEKAEKKKKQEQTRKALRTESFLESQRSGPDTPRTQAQRARQERLERYEKEKEKEKQTGSPVVNTSSSASLDPGSSVIGPESQLGSSRRFTINRESTDVKKLSSEQRISNFKSEVTRVFEEFDRDGNKSITEDELDSIFSSLRLELTKDQLRTAFMYADTDGSGEIDAKEFERLIIELVLRKYEKEGPKRGY